MVQKKIVAISFEEGVVFRARVFARTLLSVFLVKDYSILKYLRRHIVRRYVYN